MAENPAAQIQDSVQLEVFSWAAVQLPCLCLLAVAFTYSHHGPRSRPVIALSIPVRVHPLLYSYRFLCMPLMGTFNITRKLFTGVAFAEGLLIMVNVTQKPFHARC